MSSVKVLDDIYWVGAVDWDVRTFHGFTYSTHRGTTYNSYLIVDDKIALVDSVYAPFAAEMMARIREVVPPEKIDYVIANHVETDHSGSIAEVLKHAPKAKVVGTARCKQGLSKHYFGDWDFQVVKTGDEIEFGKRKLKFIEAPMLHWPDSMFTYIEKDALLMPNDAFGQHIATSKRFNDEIDENSLMVEAGKYYANILWPLSSLVIKKIEEVQKQEIKISMIAPSHGVIWRSTPMKIVEAYLRWAKGESEKRVLVVYDTMWGSTEKMARAIVDGISSANVEAKVYRIPSSDRGDIIGDLLEAKGILVGSSTINNGILPTLAPLLEDLKGLKPRGKISAAFGSYGWAGGSIKVIEESLRQAGMEIASPSMSVNWVPNKEEIQKCYEFGKSFAAKIASS
ncbi:MAG: flavodoxin domain-containing protein [Candidatus Bathyarchaeota archaeon]|nr:flavodoxin domain-containing protein [Candidatus Bathyarchaeota archaeon]